MRESGGSPLFIGELVRFSDVVDVTARAGAPAADDDSGALMHADARVRAAATDEPAAAPGPPAARRGRRLRPAAAHAARARAAELGSAEIDAITALWSAHLARTRVTDGRQGHRGVSRSDSRDGHRPPDACRSARDPRQARDRARRRSATSSRKRWSSTFAAPGSRERAAPYAVDAADRAREALAFDRAASFYQTALDLAPFEPAARREIQIKRGDALAAGGRGHDAAEVYLGGRHRRAGRRSGSN